MWILILFWIYNGQPHVERVVAVKHKNDCSAAGAHIEETFKTAGGSVAWICVEGK